jgi:hypothetical protein
VPQRYEYKFVRLEQGKSGWTGAPFPEQGAREGYQQEVQRYAAEGWRLVQIFAPGVGHAGGAAYYELILEREIADGPAGQ